LPRTEITSPKLPAPMRRGAYSSGVEAAGREDDLHLRSGLAGRLRERGRRGGYRSPDGDGARTRQDRRRGSGRRYAGCCQGHRLHNGNGALRPDPRGPATLLRGALSCLLDGRSLSAHRPSAPHRDRSRRGRRVNEVLRPLRSSRLRAKGLSTITPIRPLDRARTEEEQLPLI
jgi:hypothetical protein